MVRVPTSSHLDLQQPWQEHLFATMVGGGEPASHVCRALDGRADRVDGLAGASCEARKQAADVGEVNGRPQKLALLLRARRSASPWNSCCYFYSLYPETTHYGGSRTTAEPSRGKGVYRVGCGGVGGGEVVRAVWFLLVRGSRGYP